MNKNKFYVYALLCLSLMSYPCIASESEEEEADQTLISVRNHSPQPEQQPPILLSPHLSGGHDQIESWIDEYIKNFQLDKEAIFDVDAFFKNQLSEETTVIGGDSVGPSNFIKTPETLRHPNSYFEEEGDLGISGKLKSFMNSIIMPTTPPDFFLPRTSRVVDTPNDHFFALQIPEIPTDEPQTFNSLEEEEEEEANSFKSYKIKSLKCQFKTCECKNEFESSELLKKHIQEQHTSVKNVCEYCGLKLHHISILEIHKRTHTGEKPFPCRTCDKSFAQLSNLKAHTKTHTGDKPFKCTIDKCDWAFKDQGNLIKHINSIHKGYKPYRCTSCDKSFAKKQGLQRHQNSKKGCQFQLKRAHDFASKVNPSAPASLDQADASEPSTKIVAIGAPEYEFPEDEFEVVDCDTYPTTTSQQPMLPFFDSEDEPSNQVEFSSKSDDNEETNREEENETKE